MVAIATVPGRVARFVGFAPQTVSDAPIDITLTLESGGTDNAFYPESIDGATALGGVDIGTIATYSPVLFPDTIDADPDPFGPDIFTQAGLDALIQEVYVELHEPNGTLVDTLANAYGNRFQVALNEVGSGSLQIPADDPVVTSLTVGREVWCWVHGTHVSTFRIDGQPEKKLIESGEESAQVIAVSGKGLAGQFDGSRTYPQKGVTDPLLGQHRIYSFASIDFPNAGSWTPAVQLSPQSYLDPIRHDFIQYITVIAGQPEITEELSATAPLEWPVDTAFWIWGQSDTTPLGFNYFRKVISIAADTMVNIAVSADNYYTFYLDGTPLLGDDGSEINTWKQYRLGNVLLPAGTYTLAAAVENADNGQTNPAAFLFAMYTTDDDDNVTSVICVSDSSWISLAYPASVPGWTPGQVLLDHLAEAQVRGALPLWTTDFAAFTDSHGNAWVCEDGSGPYMPMFSVPIGSTFNDVLSSLVAQGRIDWRVSAAGHVLQAFNHNEVRSPLTTFVSTGVVATTNILTMDSTPSAPPQTALLVKWSNGLFDVANPTAVALYGRIEGYITIDALNIAEATRQANVALADATLATYSHLFGIDPIADTDCPTVGFNVGDYITAPNEVLTPTSMRCWSISVSGDNMGRATFAVELNRRLKPPDVVKDEILQTIGRGVVGSTTVRNVAMSLTNPLRRLG